MGLFVLAEDRLLQAAGFDPAELHALAAKVDTLAESITEKEWALVKRLLKHLAGK